jgi:NTE family protein
MSIPRIGLVLGGGGARGAFTAGAVSYLRFNDIQRISTFPGVSGTSTGALVGSLVCCNQFAKLEKIYTTVQTGDIIHPAQSLIASVLGLEAATLAGVLFGDVAVFSADALGQIIDKNVDFEKIRERADVSRLLLNTVDLQTGEIRVYDSKRHSAATLRSALLASASEPVFMPPIDVQTEGGLHQLVDGGVRELVPLSAAFRSGVDVDVIVAILTNPVEPAPEERLTSILEILARTIDLTLSDVGTNDVAMARHINALLRMMENARDLDVLEEVLAGVEEDIIEDLEGKRSIPIILVSPEEPLPISSLDFDPSAMQEMFNLGFNRAVDLIEPFLVRWQSVV